MIKNYARKQIFLNFLRLLEITLFYPQIPPDLPGVGKHFPDIPELDAAKRLSSGVIEFNGHFDEFRLLFGSKGQKLYVKGIAFDLTKRCNLPYYLSPV